MLIPDACFLNEIQQLYFSTFQVSRSLLDYFLRETEVIFIDFLQKVFFSVRNFVVFQSLHFSHALN
jgi:hypothetical protein